MNYNDALHFALDFTIAACFLLLARVMRTPTAETLCHVAAGAFVVLACAAAWHGR